ncbi:tail completion protein gp17 [Vreelandella alkaliphila]|uniref:DUF3168 domain-containing protein n=1 Tax=Vreelandella alkaliphila TaxID=272774 RepID=A0A7C9NPT4_9GAMM|nr:DUF3168 domain-containing protein [Halomonas alkaliphila]NDL70508.1 DUF3168 domain-containing protein [Halomonas alkaliphila]
MIQAEIYTAIQALSGGRVYALVAPQGTAVPYLVHSLPSRTSDDTIEGMGAMRASVQLDAYAHSQLEADMLLEAAIDALDPLHPSELMQLQDYETDTGLYRATAELTIWY